MVDGHRRQNRKASKHKMSFMSTTTVCCMCGDVGFPDKIFRCSRCTSRFQHSYCSNYYNSQSPAEICDWCRYDESNNNSSPSSSSSKHQATHLGNTRKSTDQHHRRLQLNNRSEYSSADRLKQLEHREEKGNTNKQGGVPSPRTATKRYKLLKDVMC